LKEKGGEMFVVHILFELRNMYRTVSPLGEEPARLCPFRRGVPGCARGSWLILILKLIKILPPRPQTSGHPSFERKRRGNFVPLILFCIPNLYKTVSPPGFGYSL
jgi:hypothetical protein